jgi:hypothetical protein
MCSAYTARHGTNEMINTQTRIKVMRYECIRCAQLSSVFISQRERAQGLTHDLCAEQVAARRKCIIYLCSARIATQVTRFSFKIVACHGLRPSVFLGGVIALLRSPEVVIYP